MPSTAKMRPTHHNSVASLSIWPTVAMFFAFFLAFAAYVHSEKQIDHAHERRLLSFQLAGELRQSSDDLTRMARSYVVTGEPRYKRYFQDILDIRNGVKPRPENYADAYWDMVLADRQPPPENGSGGVALLDRMRRAGFSEAELGMLMQAKASSDELTHLEFEAMKLVESNSANIAATRLKASLMLRDGRYNRAKAEIMAGINAFFKHVNERTLAAVHEMEGRASLFRIIAILIGCGAIFLLLRNYRYLRTVLGGDADEIHGLLSRIGRGDIVDAAAISPGAEGSILAGLVEMQGRLRALEQGRQSAAQQQRDDAARMSAILDNVLDGIITIGERGIIESFNQAATNIFGYGEAEVIGRNVKMLMPEPYHGEHDTYLSNYTTTGNKKIIGIGRQVVGRRKDGTTFPMDLAVSEMRLGDRRMFTGIVRDITERVKVERMKSEFISTVSHELRTPLTSIRGSLALIVGGVVGELPAAAKPMIEIAHKNSERLILLVNDILDMEKIEEGKMEFDMQPCELMPLLVHALEGNRAYGEQFKVSYELENSLPGTTVKVDANRLMQVLANLLSNAAKFSPPGGKVTVAVMRLGSRVRVEIKDHGSGIPDEFKGRIFQKFAQADASDTKKKGGTGLGLSITKAMVEQMGGAIGFESQPNVLTTFFVEFPMFDAVSRQAVAERVEAKRVLICEDDRDVAALLRLVLEQAGLASDVAYDAAQAKQLLAQHRYAAMTLDLAMPDQDGVSLIRELRAAEATANLPIVVVSVSAGETHDELSCDAFSVVDWIGKPIDQVQLVAALNRAVNATPHARPRVLHVEDDKDIAVVVYSIVGDVAEVDNAVTLADARRLLAEKHYDLAILDVSLPDGSGMELLPQLNAATPPVPVLVFSAREITREEILGVKAALVKSRTDNEQLLATIKRLIGGTS